jgi:hypothetical protein
MHASEAAGYAMAMLDRMPLIRAQVVRELSQFGIKGLGGDLQVRSLA